MLQEYGGRILRVNFSDKPKPRNQPLYPETEHKLFIGNLAWTVTTESLTQAFLQYGNVVGARVVYDGETGRSRGYAFVSYATRSEMEAALESLNGVVYSLSLSQLTRTWTLSHTPKKYKRGHGAQVRHGADTPMDSLTICFGN